MDDGKPVTKTESDISVEDLKGAMRSMTKELIDALHEFETNLVNEFRRYANDPNTD
jgi:hypothetical protein